MQIDRKRVFKTVLGIAGLVAFAMLIPKAMDNHRRYQEYQALQIEERTLLHSTPATTAEQKAILQAILLTGAEPHNHDYLNKLRSMVLVEETPSCAYGSVKLKNEIKSKYVEIDNSQCQRGLQFFLQYNADSEALSGLGRDLLKANRYPWLNPNPKIAGLTLLGKNQCNIIATSENCEELFRRKISEERNFEKSIIVVSRAVISKEKDKALVTLEYSTYLFSYMVAILLKKIDGRWLIEDTERVYIT
jgi:hypothetical protein